MTQSLNKQFGFSLYAKIGSIAFLALMLLSIGAVSAPRVSADSQTVSVAFGGYMLHGTSASNAFLTVNVTVTKNNPEKIPQGTFLGLTTAHNGSIYNSQIVSLVGQSGNSLTYSFNVPFAGAGEYIFAAYVVNPHGARIFAFSVIDPLIEPEW